MLKKLNYTQKNLLLILGVVIIGYLAYSRAISATLNLKEQCAELENQSLQAESVSDEIKLIQLQLSEINRMLGSGHKNPGDINRNLVQFITQRASNKNIILKDFQEVHIYNGPQMNLYTQPCILQGNFKDMVKLIHELENEFAIVNVASLRFYTKEDLRTKKNYLYAECYIQTINKQ